MRNTSHPNWGEDMRTALDRMSAHFSKAYPEYCKRRALRLFSLLRLFFRIPT